MRDTLSRLLQQAWWQPRRGLVALLLRPLSWVVTAVASRRRRAAALSDALSARLPVPVIVVGNLVVGGAGKTPATLALVALLRDWGYHPGIVSRGYGRAGDAPQLLDAATAAGASPAVFGDEPLLMHQRTRAPVAVARQRRAAAVLLLSAHPEVDIVVADDGLQHHALPRDIELVVFDSRGLGNGLVLPAGPLREPPSALWPDHAPPVRLVLLNGDWPAPPARPQPAPAAATWSAERQLAGAVALADWAHGAPALRERLHALRGAPRCAVAGIAEPERFFRMLEAEGLQLQRRPRPDHDPFTALPWPPGTADVIVTEKDAVKLAGRPLGGTRVWVVPLDFRFPPDLQHALRHALARVRDALQGHSP